MASTASSRDDRARVHGPIISCADPQAHHRLLTDLGLIETGRGVHHPAAAHALFGVDQPVLEIRYDTPGTASGVRLVRFDPPSDDTIRDPSAGFDANAPKVIDFYTPDFDAAVARLDAGGWHFRADIARYELPEGAFQEAHIWGPDQVVYAVITGPADFFKDFVTVTDRLFSEPQSLSGPVADPDAAEAFLIETFGFTRLHAYGIEDDSFRALVGIEGHRFSLTARNLGRDLREPYLGLIHYGLPPTAYRSLKERCLPPRRGLLGATIMVADVGATLARAQAAGGRVLAPRTVADLPVVGRVHSALIAAPHGGLFQVLAPA